MIMNKKRIVITGGPCCGKTTLLNALGDMAYTTVPEAARMIIEEQQKRGSNCVPWMDLYGFQEIATGRALELESSFNDSFLFCDRGIIDNHGYCTNGKVPTPDLINNLGVNRYDAVFILDPIQVYQKDDSRKENPEEAKKIHQAIFYAYKSFGYNPIRIPVMATKDRVKYFVELAEGFVK